VSDPQRPADDGEPTRVYPPAEELPPVVAPMPVQRAQQPMAQPAPAQPAQPTGPKLDPGTYWAGAAATILVAALIGVAASVIFEQVFDIELVSPPDLLEVGPNVAWAGAAALFALAAAVVLQLLVSLAPSPRMFFGWLMGLATVILAVLPWTNPGDTLATSMTSLVWIVLGVAISSLLGAVLVRSIRPR